METGGRLGVDRRGMILLLRWVIIVTAAYIVLIGRGGTVDNRHLTFVLLFALSNVLLAFLPRHVVEKPEFGPLLLLVDATLTLFGLSWRHGFSQDLLIVYFFTIFLTTVGESLAAIATSSALVMVLYGYWLSTQDRAPAPEEWLRLPFFFLIAVFYGSLIEQLKGERRRREMAERESGHLRMLLRLAGAFSESHATREFIEGIGRHVEEVCPGLSCRVVLGGSSDDLQNEKGTVFSLHTHGRRYGALLVEKGGGVALDDRELMVCAMVAHAAAGALYTAERSKAAESADEVKNQFLATISHELRTPLHAVVGYADVMKMMIPQEREDLQHCAERVRINACRLQDLVEQVLTFAELRAGHRSVRTEEVSIADLFDELELLTREQVIGKRVECIFRTPEDDGILRTDRRKLRQVLSCVLSNAAKFTEEGQIIVTTARRAGAFEIVVSDTGIGIPADHLQTIFTEFKQVDGSLTRRHGGLGLGLALSQEIIDLLGGSLWVESREGAGTTVRIRLPDVTAAPTSAIAEAPVRVNGRFVPVPGR